MFKELNKWNLITRCKPILYPNGPWYIREKPFKIYVPEHMQTMDWDQPWIHIKHDDERNCKMNSMIFVDCLNMLPKKCLECWKVVFRPQYLRDMFNLMPVMERLAEDKGYSCKLGCERRKYTGGKYGHWGLWGAYFYNKTQKTGIKCWEDVKDAVAATESLKHLLDDVDEDGYPE